MTQSDSDETAIADDAPLMLDTNVFNHLVDGRVRIEQFGQRRLLATRIQFFELKATKNAERRGVLLARFSEVEADLESAAFAFGVSGAGFDEARWGENEDSVERMFFLLKELDKKSGKNSSAENMWKDVLIADAALISGAVLVTGDNNLREVMRAFGGQAVDAATL